MPFVVDMHRRGFLACSLSIVPLRRPAQALRVVFNGIIVHEPSRFAQLTMFVWVFLCCSDGSVGEREDKPSERFGAEGPAQERLWPRLRRRPPYVQVLQAPDGLRFSGSVALRQRLCFRGVVQTFYVFFLVLHALGDICMTRMSICMSVCIWFPRAFGTTGVKCGYGGTAVCNCGTMVGCLGLASCR